jgi:hypothetical protein
MKSKAQLDSSQTGVAGNVAEIQAFSEVRPKVAQRGTALALTSSAH